MYARKTDVRFPPSLRADVSGAASGLAPIVKTGRGCRGLNALTDPESDAGMIVSFWETEAVVKATEGNPSYVVCMSTMSSFLYEASAPKTYEAEVRE